VNTETDKNEAGAEGSESGEHVASDPPTPSEPASGDTSERDKLKQQLLRTAADFDNFRKRSRREVEDAALRGKELTIREFLPIFDNLDRALSAAGNTEDGRAIVEGVRMVLKQFEDTCERIGIRRIATVGERFDPTAHEAIQQLETSEHPPGTIVAEVAAGYMFGPRLLRAAMVVVAKPPAPPSNPASPSEAKGS
jgi:molecular chaperone GrpE